MNRDLYLERIIRLTAAILVVVGFPVSSRADSLIDRVTAEIGVTTYQLNIDEVKVPLKLPPQRSSVNKNVKYDGYVNAREVTIMCLEKCSSNVPYHERFVDSPISAFRLRDDSPYLVTTWTSGSAYRIRVYYINGGNISKVLEQGSVSAPVIAMSNDGSLVIQLSNPDLASTLARHSNMQIWRWNGKEYQVW